MIDFFQLVFSGENSLLRTALLVGWFGAVPLGCVGSVVVTRRISSLAGALSHFVLSGIGIAVWWNAGSSGPDLSPVAGALVSGLVAAWLLATFSNRRGHRIDSWVTILWAGGMSVGLLFISWAPRAVDPMSYLFGNLLLVGSSDLVWVAVLAVTVLAGVLVAFPLLLSTGWNESLARSSGQPVWAIRFLELVMVTASVVLMLKWMGVVLVLGLLVLPSATASLWTRRLSGMMVLSSLLCLVYVTGGMALSYELNWLTGPTTVLLAATVHGLAIGARRLHPGLSPS